MQRPLDGVSVVSVEQAVAAPFATRQLADLGADVIKIERPDGGDFARNYDTAAGGNSSVFVWLNRGKRSVTLDLKAADGQRIFEELLARADVFVQNLAPAAAVRAGIDPEAVRRRHPRVIPCAVSGYGSGGPMRDAKAYDLLVQGEAGVLSITGGPDAMAKVGVSIADISAGMYAFSGILAALLHRDRHGEALPLDVSLFDSLAEWMSHPLYYTADGTHGWPRMGTNHPAIAPYGEFRTADGVALLIAVQNQAEWRRLCAVVLGDPARADDPLFATNADRVVHRTALDSLVDRRFAELTERDARDLLDRAGIANSRINDVTDLPDHPQLVERDRWIPTLTPLGPVRTLYPPGIPGTGRAELGGVPGLGEHTDQVLRALGRTGADIDRLRDRKVI